MQDVEIKKDYSISELSDAGSVTARTIRYYVAEGLLAPPGKGGRGATYNEEHLARLQLIKRLKEEYLPLQEIATLMRGLDRQAVMDLLKQKQRTSIAPRSSAKNYLKDLLEVSGGSGASDSGRLRPQVEARTRHEPEIPEGIGWRRLVIDEGVELNVREDRLGRETDKVRQLFQFARGLFLTR